MNSKHTQQKTLENRTKFGSDDWKKLESMVRIENPQPSIETIDSESKTYLQGNTGRTQSILEEE